MRYWATCRKSGPLQSSVCPDSMQSIVLFPAGVAAAISAVVLHEKLL